MHRRSLLPAHCDETLPGGVRGEGGKIPFPQLPEVLLVSHTDEDNRNYDDDDILLKAASQ